jgi:hypothetical protein
MGSVVLGIDRTKQNHGVEHAFDHDLDHDLDHGTDVA